jgi:hypothetical protein
MVRVTRPGDPVTVGLTRLGQARVLEERPTLPSSYCSVILLGYNWLTAYIATRLRVRVYERDRDRMVLGAMVGVRVGQSERGHSFREHYLWTMRQNSDTM